ncbi:hypothetical protein Dsin_013499 [Dipteronia sinensis]|uniref:Myosin motor domain-containing protein n=1 Tax=Dipteronia sinensis TaxID=43782 RepID=A0AAE0ALB4_9ROSI|nr:hypothetical protein Dsin_013499 [Dipteronia sinensis]
MVIVSWSTVDTGEAVNVLKGAVVTADRLLTHVFKMEQENYTKEEINWSYIEFVDNHDVLDLIEKLEMVFEGDLKTKEELKKRILKGTGVDRGADKVHGPRHRKQLILVSIARYSPLQGQDTQTAVY